MEAYRLFKLVLCKVRLVPKEGWQIGEISGIDLFVWEKDLETAVKNIENEPTFDKWRVSWKCIWPVDPEGIPMPVLMQPTATERSCPDCCRTMTILEEGKLKYWYCKYCGLKG